MTPPPRRPPTREPRTLLADDNGDNVALLKIALKRAGYDNPVQAVCRGEQAVEYLKGWGDYADRTRFPLPSIVFLDTRMPGMSGWEVLRWVRQQPEFELLPVIVFSGSERDGDRERAAELGANAYEIKPQEFDEFIRVVKKVCDFWLRGGGVVLLGFMKDSSCWPLKPEPGSMRGE